MEIIHQAKRQVSFQDVISSYFFLSFFIITILNALIFFFSLFAAFSFPGLVNKIILGFISVSMGDIIAARIITWKKYIPSRDILKIALTVVGIWTFCLLIIIFTSSASVSSEKGTEGTLVFSFLILVHFLVTYGALRFFSKPN